MFNFNKVFLTVLLWGCFAVLGKAAEPVDTIAFNGKRIERIVKDNTVNSKGKPVVKYYIMVDNYLVPTTKTVCDKIILCKKHNAKCALDAIVNKKTKQIKKIILG